MGHRADNSLIELGEAFSSTATTAKTLPRYSVELVTSQNQLKSLWNPAFKEIFTDKNDREPLTQLIDRFKNGENFFMLKDSEGNVQGMSLPQILLGEETAQNKPKNETVKSDLPQAAWNKAQTSAASADIPLRPMYVPWVGVKQGMRNIGAGTDFDQAVADIMKEKFGITHTLLDIEDPERLHTSGYSKEELPEAIENAARRINYWKRQGFIVVDDPRVKYVRPSSEDDQQIQAYDHMTVRFENADIRKKFMSEDGTKISIDFVRQSYLDMTRIQYGNLSEEELRAGFPAVNQYLTDIDNAMKNDRWLSVNTTPIVPKATPNQPIDLVRVAANQNHPNARVPYDPAQDAKKLNMV